MGESKSYYEVIAEKLKKNETSIAQKKHDELENKKAIQKILHDDHSDDNEDNSLIIEKNPDQDDYPKVLEEDISEYRHSDIAEKNQSSVLSNKVLSQAYNYIKNKPRKVATIHEISIYLDLSTQRTKLYINNLCDNNYIKHINGTASYTLASTHVLSDTDGKEDLADIVSEKNKLNSNYLAKIATDQVTPNEASDIFNTTDTASKFKMFMIQLARTEMGRVVRFMDTLTVIQDRYMEQALINDNLGLSDIEPILGTINDQLNRSLAIVDKFANDPELQSALSDSQEVNTLREARDSEESILSDKKSRDKVREAATKLIDQLNDKANEAEEDSLALNREDELNKNKGTDSEIIDGELVSESSESSDASDDGTIDDDKSIYDILKGGE